jgi:hypothetical protein
VTCKSLNTPCMYYSTLLNQCSASASSTQTAQATGVAIPTEPSHSSSKAWIAGVVIGPVFGLAILFGLGVLIWTIRRQSKQRQLARQQQPVLAPTEEHKGTWVFVPAGSTAPAPQTESPSQGRSPRESELPAQPHVSELSSERELAELDLGTRTI